MRLTSYIQHIDTTIIYIGHMCHISNTFMINQVLSSNIGVHEEHHSPIDLWWYEWPKCFHHSSTTNTRTPRPLTPTIHISRYTNKQILRVNQALSSYIGVHEEWRSSVIRMADISKGQRPPALEVLVHPRQIFTSLWTWISIRWKRKGVTTFQSGSKERRTTMTRNMIVEVVEV